MWKFDIISGSRSFATHPQVVPDLALIIIFISRQSCNHSYIISQVNCQHTILINGCDPFLTLHLISDGSACQDRCVCSTKIICGIFKGGRTLYDDGFTVIFACMSVVLVKIESLVCLGYIHIVRRHSPLSWNNLYIAVIVVLLHRLYPNDIGACINNRGNICLPCVIIHLPIAIIQLIH